MAKRKYSTMKKIQPAQLTMNFSTPTISANGQELFYVDLSQVASLLNRRFYRQGINWAVSGIKVLSQSRFEGSVTISKLPNTWVMSNAWEKGFRAWERMNKESMDESDSLRPKFLDFKIYADALHHDKGYGANLLPQDSGGNVVTVGEWDSSKVVIPETTTATGAVTSYEIVAVGANNPGVSSATGLNAKSLIEGYAASRALPDILDPNTPDDANSYAQNWQMAMFNEGTLQDNVVLDDLITENNQSPYPFENGEIPGAPGTFWTDTYYPGGANQLPELMIHDIEFISPTTIGGTTRFKGGNFPCGLMKFDVVNASDITQNIVIQVELVPGNHRGYLCEPMTEM